jgi:hypothetical protein
VRCTFKQQGLVNILQTFRGSAAGAGLFKGFTFLKGETFFWERENRTKNPISNFPLINLCFFTIFA